MATDGTTLPTGTGSARLKDAGAPNRDEVRQRVNSLYDRAETDSGTFNATRAMSSPRRRPVGGPAGGGGRPAADPTLESVARQWFDLARDRIGPTSAATLPGDRRPALPAPRSAPEQSRDRDAVRDRGGSAASGPREPGSGGRPAPELPGRAAVAALPAPEGATRPAPQAAPQPRTPQARQTPLALPPATAPTVTGDQAGQPRRAGRGTQGGGVTWGTGQIPAQQSYDTGLTGPSGQAGQMGQAGQPSPSGQFAEPAQAGRSAQIPPQRRPWDTGSLPVPQSWDTGHLPVQQATDSGQPVAATQQQPWDTGQFATQQPWETGSLPVQQTWETGSLPVQQSWETGSLPVQQSWETGQLPVQQPWETGPLPAQQTWETGALPVQQPWETGQLPVQQTWETGPLPVQQTAETGQLPVQQPWETGQFADRHSAESGQPLPAQTWPEAASGSDPLGTAAYPAPGPDLAATSGFAVPAPPLPPQASSFPTPETGLLAASYGDLLTAPAPTAAPVPVATAAPAAAPTATATLPAPDPGWASPEAYAAPAPAPLPAAAPEPAPAAPEFYLPVPGTPTTPPPAPAPTATPLGVTGHATGSGYLGKADKALAFARAQIGRPCVTGATGPESYDCASLSQAAWRAAGVVLPRAAIDQAQAFTRVGLDALHPGDLVFFHDDLSHTGICTSGETMIHAPGPGAAIREESIHALGEGALRGAVRPA